MVFGFVTAIQAFFDLFEERNKLPKKVNRRIEGYRVGILLDDPIAQRWVAHLFKSDVVAVRDSIVKAELRAGLSGEKA